MISRGAAAGALALVLLLAPLAACSGDDDGGDGDDRGDGTAEDAAAPPATRPDEGACALLSLEDVTGLFGADAVAAPPEGSGASTCLWEAPGGDALPTHQLQLAEYAGDTPLDPAAYGESSEPIEVDGADEAFVVADGFVGTTAAARSGDRALVLTYAVLAGGQAGDEGDNSARADDLVELLATALAAPAG
jgi:hypothetical protein